MDVLTHRAARPEDEAFLFRLFISTKKDKAAFMDGSIDRMDSYLQEQWKVKQFLIDTQFPQAVHLVLMRDREPIGKISLDYCHDHIHIVDLSILPEYRNDGIGTLVLLDLQRHAESLKLPLRLKVEHPNRARLLFDRLGFVIVHITEKDRTMSWVKANKE